MSIDNELLLGQLQLMEKLQSKLNQSYTQCQNISLKQNLSEDDEIEFEALTARFSRFSDYLVQKLFRTIDIIELEDTGTLRDRINRAEKKGWIENAREFVEISTLRNIIAHEYGDDEVIVIYAKVLQLTPILLNSCNQVKLYIKSEKYI